MLSKNELKYIQSLCQKKQRQEEGVFIAEGTKLAQELLQSNYQIKKIYATADWESPSKLNTECVFVSDEELQKMSSLQTANQVLLIVEQKVQTSAPELKKGFTLILDGIQDPGNLGTLIRIADWFGIEQIIAGAGTAELYNPKVIQSTMGSFIRVNLWYLPLAQVLEATTLPVYGALLNGKDVHQFDRVNDGCLIIGNESKGISEELLAFINHPVTIPRIGGAESLNAAVAAGIILSHFRK